MDNTFIIDENYPPGTKVLLYGEDDSGNNEIKLSQTTHLMPMSYYLGQKIQAIDLSEITDKDERIRIENKRAAAWKKQNIDPTSMPVRMDDNAIPAGRAFRVPSGGRKSRRGRKNKKSRKRRSRKTTRRRRRR